MVLKKLKIRTCEHMILGQLRIWARQAKNAPLIWRIINCENPPISIDNSNHHWDFDFLNLRLPMKLRAIRPPITPRSPCFRGLGFFKRSNIVVLVSNVDCRLLMGIYYTFVLIVSYLQTYLKLSKSSLFVLSMNLERRTSPNIAVGLHSWLS